MIAVLSVVLYHFGLPGLPGGFTGVDVFFVISGYLIGGILWRDYRTNGTLSLSRFYIRRVKRLAPAYFAMAAATIAVAWVILLPFEFRELGKQLIAATVYLSNVLFWRGEGYFDIGADSKVLLHTWSLSVEEQFYIFLPVAILLLKRWPRLLLATLIACFAASLIAAIALTPSHQTTTFYLFPFRAWEMLAGVLLAIWLHDRRRLTHPALSYVGLALILAGFASITPDGFPGWQAVIPIAGTVLMLLNGPNPNLINRALSTPVPVFFGRISYSLYLWHWPVLVLSKYWRDGYSGPLEVALWIALSILLATLSWALIETPFRRTNTTRGWVVLGALAVPSAATMGLGALAYIQNGIPTRFDSGTQTHIRASADFLQDFSRCYRPSDGPFAGVELCPIGPDGPPRVLIWGDSHLRALKEGLEDAAHTTKTPGLIIWHAGCAPFIGLTKRESYATRAEDVACARDVARIREGLATLTQAHSLMLVGRWAYYASGHGTGRDAENTIQLSGHGGSNNTEVLSRAVTASLPQYTRQFRRIFLMRQPPEIPDYDSREVARKLAHGRIDAAGLSALTIAPRDRVNARDNAAMAPFRTHLDDGTLTLINPWPRICTANECSAIQDGQGWYFDNNHLTNTAARALTPLFQPLFKGPTP